MEIHTLLDKVSQRPAYRLLLHVLFWLAFTGVGYYFNNISFNQFDTRATWYISAKNTLVAVFFFYPFMYFIIPTLFRRKRYIAGLLSSLLLVFLYGWIDAWGEKQIVNNCTACMAYVLQHNNEYGRFLQMTSFNMMIVRLLSLGLFYQLFINLSIPLAIKVGSDFYQQKIKLLKTAQANLQLEFNLLKSQINPHFLFNTLNNLYSLVEHDKKKLAISTIASLSNFMRYTLYECESDQVAVEKEISLINHYLALEKLRLNHTALTFLFDTDDPHYQVPPLLVIPLIENAIKFVDDTNPAAFININIIIKNSLFQCTVINSTSAYMQSIGNGGLGLKNLQKRLRFHFGKEFDYTVNATQTEYSTTLTFKVCKPLPVLS
jgi:hypothetical protein